MRGARTTLLLAMAALAAVPASAARETVILLHGLARTEASMKPVERRLRAAGYDVVNVGYPSRRRPIEALARDHLAPAIAAHAGAPRLHFVTHSMGGILLRCHLRYHRVPNLGRVVMLAPPNAGSEVADRLRDTWFYRLVNGPAGRQLGTDGLPAALGPWPAGAGELGIIAGDRSFNPLFSSWIAGPDDGKVSVARARLEGMKDFLVVPHTHTWLMRRGAVLDQVEAFLRDGRFRRPAEP